MWRFLLSGLFIIGGLIVLFLGSFGDPVITLSNLPSTFEVAYDPPTQVPIAEVGAIGSLDTLPPPRAQLSAKSAEAESDAWEVVRARLTRAAPSLGGAERVASQPRYGDVREAAGDRAGGHTIATSSLPPAPSTPPVASIVNPPENRLPVNYLPPWQNRPASVWRVHPKHPSHVPARFFAAIGRDLRMLFHASPHNGPTRQARAALAPIEGGSGG